MSKNPITGIEEGTSVNSELTENRKEKDLLKDVPSADFPGKKDSNTSPVTEPPVSSAVISDDEDDVEDDVDTDEEE